MNAIKLSKPLIEYAPEKGSNKSKKNRFFKLMKGEDLRIYQITIYATYSFFKYKTLLLDNRQREVTIATCFPPDTPPFSITIKN
jgi:hypothetical protein